MRGYRADGRRGVVGGMSGPPPKIQISLSYIVKLLKIGLGPHPLTGKHRYPSNIPPPWKKILDPHMWLHAMVQLPKQKLCRYYVLNIRRMPVLYEDTAH